MEYSTRGELSRDGLSRVVESIRRSTGHQGKLEEALGSMEWQTVGELSQIAVRVSPREGETSIQIIGDRSAASAALFMVPAVVGAIGIGITGAIVEPTGVAGIVGVVAGPLTAAFLAARTAWATTTKVFRKKLRDLMDAVSRTVDQNVRIPAPGAEPPEEGSGAGG